MSPCLPDHLPAGRTTFSACVCGTAIEAVVELRPEREAAASNAAMRLAEEVVAATLQVDVRRVRVAPLQPSGRPVGFVDGVVANVSVSVSHVVRGAAAVAAPTAFVGVDLVVPADAGPALDHFFTADELAFLPGRPALLRALLWSAKEAAYKAAGIDTEFRPRRVSITRLCDRAFAWTITAEHVGAHGEGVFRDVGPVVVAIAACRQKQARRRSGGGASRREEMACS